MESIISNKDECFLCGSRRMLHTHHCLHGSMRKKADQDGLTVKLCQSCHQALHDQGQADRYLQKKAQEAWMKHYAGDEDSFRQRYGKSYL